MKALNNSTVDKRPDLPLKVIQFGEGNFLRGFVDWIIDILNEKTDFNGGVHLIQPLEGGMVDMIMKQDGLYHVWLNGLSNGQAVDSKRLINCITGGTNPYTDYAGYLKLAEAPEVEFVFSNTTEAGIYFDEQDTPNTVQAAFPGKLAALLFARFEHFKGDVSKGLKIIPCELIDKNGEILKETILRYADHFEYPKEFKDWILTANTFCNTLVDRIVPGYPKDTISQVQGELGFEDKLVVKAEPFHLWVIEADSMLAEEFPASEVGLNVLFVKDQTPYRTRKVRILNGAHTAVVHKAILSGLVTVEDVMNDEEFSAFLKKLVYDEIIPTLDLPESELTSFAEDVLERFRNPFMRHELMSITLNSISKFKVRVLPSIMEYKEKFDRWPEGLLQSFSALIVFYKGEWRDDTITLNDDPNLLSRMKEFWINGLVDVKGVLSEKSFWGMDLSEYSGLVERVESNVLHLLEQEKVVK